MELCVAAMANCYLMRRRKAGKPATTTQQSVRGRSVVFPPKAASRSRLGSIEVEATQREHDWTAHYENRDQRQTGL